MNKDEILWNILKEHIGHNVEIVYYGDKDSPVDICLECTDCNEVILDAEDDEDLFASSGSSSSVRFDGADAEKEIRDIVDAW